MEPWKLAVIAALGAGIVGYGVFANSSANHTLLNKPPGVRPTLGASSAPSKFIGKTLPAWPTMKQWMNSSSPPNLALLKGKPVLLEVFRIECNHCVEAAPVLVQLHKRYAPRGVQFVGVQSPASGNDPENPENNWKTVQSWVKGNGYTWPVGFDAGSAWFQGKFGKDVYYPSLFLIDASGKVTFFQTGHDAEKALQLAVELEKIAPGKGDVQARATDLSRFLAPGMGLGSDATSQQSLANELTKRINGVAAPQTRT